MVFYRFYKEEYLGSQISEHAWAELSARAEETLRALERKYTLRPYGPASRDMALCAIAEVIHLHRKQGTVSRQSIGGVTVEYAPDSEKQLQKQILQGIAGFMELYRGVG